jgi:hypothetical protein
MFGSSSLGPEEWRFAGLPALKWPESNLFRDASFGDGTEPRHAANSVAALVVVRRALQRKRASVRLPVTCDVTAHCVVAPTPYIRIRRAQRGSIALEQGSWRHSTSARTISRENSRSTKSRSSGLNPVATNYSDCRRPKAGVHRGCRLGLCQGRGRGRFRGG